MQVVNPQEGFLALNHTVWVSLFWRLLVSNILAVIQCPLMHSKTWCVNLDISCIPLLRKLNFNTELVWPSKVLTHERSDKAHILMVESADDVATHWSTGENRTHQMPFLWPRKVPTAEPSLTSQIYRTMKHHILKQSTISKMCSATDILML